MNLWAYTHTGELWTLGAYDHFSIICLFIHLKILKENFANSLTDWSFSSKYSRHLQFQTVWARDKKLLENVHLSPCVTCHVSHITCHMSHVTCHILSSSFFGQSGKASRWRVCYQQGLPRLVSSLLPLTHLLLLNPLSLFTIFSLNWPLDRFSQRVAMSFFLFVCLSACLWQFKTPTSGCPGDFWLRLFFLSFFLQVFGVSLLWIIGELAGGRCVVGSQASHCSTPPLPPPARKNKT